MTPHHSGRSNPKIYVSFERRLVSPRSAAGFSLRSRPTDPFEGLDQLHRDELDECDDDEAVRRSAPPPASRKPVRAA